MKIFELFKNTYITFLPEQEGHSSMASSVSASVIKSPSDPSHASIPQPPLLLPAIATRTNSASVSNRNPSIENKLPQAIVKPQILTHVIEGFVIQEGLEPFPVSVKKKKYIVAPCMCDIFLLKGNVLWLFGASCFFNLCYSE